VKLSAAVIFVRDLDRSGDFSEQLLDYQIKTREAGALFDTWRSPVSATEDDGIAVVESQDPDGMPVIVTYPSPSSVRLTGLPWRVYRY